MAVPNYTALLVRAAWRSPEEIKNSVSLQHVDGGQKQYLDHTMNFKSEDLKKKMSEPPSLP